MTVVESAIDAGDVRTALAVLRLSPPVSPTRPTSRYVTTTDGIVGNGVDPAYANPIDTIVSPTWWQVLVDGAETLLGSAGDVTDDAGVLQRLLLLDQAMGLILRALDLAEGEGLAGFASVSAAEQAERRAGAHRTLEQAFETVAGSDEDEAEDVEIGWPGDEPANQALVLQSRALGQMVGSLEGAAEALPQVAGHDGERIAGWLVRADEVAKEVIRGSRRRTQAARVQRVRLLTEGFTDLVHALGAGGTLATDGT
jgi:hypothetical protein